jgi:hypothetical protein
LAHFTSNFAEPIHTPAVFFGDSHYCSEPALALLDALGCDYIIGFAINSRLLEIAAPWRKQCEERRSWLENKRGRPRQRVRCSGRRRTREPSASHSRPRLGCFCGTFSPSRRQMRSTLVVHKPTGSSQQRRDSAVAIPEEDDPIAGASPIRNSPLPWSRRA